MNENGFWARVRKSDGCWLWTGSSGPNRYGEVRLNGRRMGAHRMAWILAYGAIPDGISVLHHCDNPPCVRPDHLFLGTDNDNIQDMIRKGRNRPGSGERHALHKLTDEKVARIRAIYAQGGVSQIELATEYGVDESVISRAITGRTWKHVAMPNAYEVTR